MRTTVRTLIAGLVVAGLGSGCGQLATQGTGPSQIVITSLVGASGAQPELFGGTLHSDVITMVEREVGGQTQQFATVYDDLAQVSMELVLKDPGQPGVATTPSALNSITFNRYRVTYKRADGRNAPGIDVPYGFDSAVTFTVPEAGTVTASFMIVRHTAKDEAPLRALAVSGVIIDTIADVTFYGRDQAGNEVIATGSIGVLFGNFGDPSS